MILWAAKKSQVIMEQIMPSSQQLTHAFYLYGRLLKYMKPSIGMLMIAMLATIIFSGVDAGFIYFLKPLLNEGLMARNQQFLKMAPLWILVIFILRGVSGFVSAYGINKCSLNVIRDLRRDLFKHLQKLPAAYYDHHSSGQILSTVIYNVEQVSNASADALTSALQSIFLIAGLVIVMLSISWKLTCMYFFIIPVVTLIVRRVGKRVRSLSLTIQGSMSMLTHRCEENIEGYRSVRLFSGEEKEIQQFNQLTQHNLKTEMKVAVSRALGSALVQIVAAMAVAITLYIAALDISSSVLSPGGFVAMCGAMLALLKPMKELANIQNKFHRGLAGAEGVFELLDQPVEKDNGTLSLQRAHGSIEVQHLHFSYDADRKILEDVNFTVKPGQSVALVGKSGSGKSTLVSLLTRFYDYHQGDILLDGVSIKDYRLEDFRRQFSVVTQQVTLFADTIANNIAYGLDYVPTEQQLHEAARLSFCLEFIAELPQGMQAVIGENGVLLSGGQRQRIAIARAILKDAPILIFDEATSALDTKSEREIQTALQLLMQNKTAFIIAHRLSTIESADCIIVLDHGRIVESGKHSELLANNHFYAELQQLQFST